MDIFEALLLGLVQGITEFIPVSSSGHLEIARQIFNFSGENFHFFVEFINIGTLLALLFYFRKRIWKILSDFIESNPFFGSIFTVAGAMAIVGIIMVFIDKIPHMSKLENENHLTPLRALIIGVMQTFALIPGTSRSGTTIIAGRLTGLDSESAAEYSFLASIPIMCAVCLKLFLDEPSRIYFGKNLWPLFLGNLVALVVGWIALTFVLNYLKKPKSLQSFGKYRIAIACLLIGVMLIIL